MHSKVRHHSNLLKREYATKSDITSNTYKSNPKNNSEGTLLLLSPVLNDYYKLIISLPLNHSYCVSKIDLIKI